MVPPRIRHTPDGINSTDAPFTCQRTAIIAQDAGNYAITNLDALLFARDFNDFPTVARKALRVIRYDGPSPISPSRSKTFFSGYAKLDQALEYVEALLPEQEVIQGVRRVTLRMFSHMALRELMANMLIHQVFLLPVPDL